MKNQPKYCPDCGQPLKQTAAHEWFCEHCHKPVYDNPIPVVDAILYDEEARILLGRRADAPYAGKLNLPGGFVEIDENFEEALAREIKEELGLDKKEYGPLKYGGSRLDITCPETNRTFLDVLLVGAIPHQEFSANAEVTEYVWHYPEDLRPEELTTQAEYDHIIRNMPLS